jgi:purine-binding chemotaxis protein CheW
MVVEVAAGDGAKRVIGYTVDKVNEVLRISSDIVEPTPPMVTSLNSDYVQGVGKLDDRLLILLNLDKVFNEQELKQIDMATTSAAA